MRRISLVLIGLTLGVLLLPGQSWAACPEDPNDNGVCDTLYIEVWPGDEQPWGGFPHYVRFPIRVTNDIPTDTIDSITGMIIQLGYSSSNPVANAQVEVAYNNTNVYPFQDLEYSIFRHLPSMQFPTERNWMMDLSEQGIGLDWDTRILNLGYDGKILCALIAGGTQDQRFCGGSRILLATLTFTLDDTTTICIDTTWYVVGRHAFARSDAVTYIPRDNMPYCQLVTRPGLPPLLLCPPDQQHSADGHTSGLNFSGEDPDGIIVDASSDFVGQGVENVGLANVAGLGTALVTGEVEYDVTDHCRSGGTVTITVSDDVGWTEECEFDVVLSNSPPEFSLFDTWRAIAGYTMVLQVSADDPDDDPVAIELEGFWYEPDSLQPPINPPSFDGGNPGFFSWVPEQTETGTWIASFSATDACGVVDTHDLSIEVGVLYCGDCNGDGEINLGDVVFLVSYLYKQGTPPEPLCMGDASGNGSIDVGDVVLLINYLFKGSFGPSFDCCP